MIKKIMNEVKKMKAEILLSLFKIVMPLQLLGTAMQAQALEQTKLVQGGLKLIADGTKVLLLVEAAAVIFLCAKEGIMYQKAEPEEKKVHKKNVQGILLTGVLIVTATASITAVFSYFM